MNLKNHCLFCLEQIAPYSVPSVNNTPTGGEVGDDDGSGIPDFQSLCRYLRISFPKKENNKGHEKSSSSSSVLLSTCDKFLCICCFDMVDQLRTLYGKLEEIRRMIGETEWKIRELVVAHDISSSLTSASSAGGGKDNNKERREEFKGKMGRMGRNRRQENECLAFVEMFQTLVASLDGSAHVDDGGAVGSTPTGNFSTSKKSRQQKKTKGLKSDDNVSTADDNEPEMKIEVPEEDHPNSFCGIDGGPDLFADFHAEDATPMSPSASGQQEEAAESPGTEDHHPLIGDGDDEEQNSDAKKKPTRAKKSTSGRALCKRKQEKKPVGRPRTKKIKKEDSLSSSDKYKCWYCDLSFSNYFKRWEHRTKFHASVKTTIQNLIASLPKVKKPLGMSKRVNIYACTICGQHVKERCNSKLLNYMEHMLSHDETSKADEGGPHSCPECDKQFNLKINLELHVACIHEARQEVIRCDLCTENYVYMSGEELIQHLRGVHGPTIYSCRHCPMSYMAFERLLLHMTKHKESKKLLCPECGSVSSTIKELRGHCFESHPELKETFNCEKCGKMYLSRDTLKTHMAVEHGFDPSTNTFSKLAAVVLTCPHCTSEKEKGRIYKTELALRLHIKAAHGKERNHECVQCGKKYFDKHMLQKHVESKHDKIRYPCPHCGKSYTESHQLTYHMRTHTGEGLLVCEICSKEFPRLSQLKTHMRNNHQKLGPEDRRVCDICGKECFGEHRLKKHKKDAHTEKKFECEVCGLRMRRMENMKMHMRTHTGERPHVCPICSKDFNRKDILAVHVKGVHGQVLKELEDKEKD